MTQPVPFLIQDEFETKYSTNPLFLGVAFNNFCYAEIDLLEKIIEGDSEEIQRMYSAAGKAYQSNKFKRKLGQDQL